MNFFGWLLKDEPPAPRHSRPQLEHLENRLVPATFTVNLTTDNDPTGDGEGMGATGDIRYCLEKIKSGMDVNNTINFDAAIDGQTISLANRLYNFLNGNRNLTISGRGVANTIIHQGAAAPCR